MSDGIATGDSAGWICLRCGKGVMWGAMHNCTLRDAPNAPSATGMMPITHGGVQWTRLCGALGLDAETARYEDVLAGRMSQHDAQRKPRVYVAGPYSQGDVAVNVRRALDMGEWLTQADCVPYVPHLTHFAHLVHPHPWDYWIEQDLIWLRVCDALVRLPGQSRGADGEVKEAQALGLPVFAGAADLATLLDIIAFKVWRKEWGK